MLQFLFRDELRETPAAFINDVGEPLREISLCILNGPNPQRECFPQHVPFARAVQLRPWYARSLSFRGQACPLSYARLQ